MKVSRIFFPLSALILISTYLFHDHFFSAGKKTDLISDRNGEKKPVEKSTKVPPLIDFPLLGEARPLDLIEMTLSFPETLRKLNGLQVRLIGYMAPFDSLEDMRRCQIVPSYVGCTFCSPPNLRQVVYVNQSEDGSLEEIYPFIEEPCQVTGIFRISEPESDHEGKKKGFVYSIENAEVTIYTGKTAKRAPGHGNSKGHKTGQGSSPLPPIDPLVLVQQVADLLGQESYLSISFENIPHQIFEGILRDEVQTIHSKRTQTARSEAFTLLGLLPKGMILSQVIAEFELSQRVALSDPKGERVYVLDSVPVDHPYVRTELVGAISDALRRQESVRNPILQNQASSDNEDTRRAREALTLGIRKVIMRRYARNLGISPSIPPPKEFARRIEPLPGTSLLNRWHSLPEDVGPYFVNFHVGPTGPIKDMKPLSNRPPTTTMEFFRPLWHQDPALWLNDPVPEDFADQLTSFPPDLTDVLGAGGLMPFLASKNSGHVVMTVSGQWAGDRWAIWKFPDDSAALLLETRWQDETTALEFCLVIPAHPFQWFFPHEEGTNKVRMIRATSTAALNRLIPTKP